MKYKLIERIFFQLKYVNFFYKYNDYYYIFFYSLSNSTLDIITLKKYFKSNHIKLVLFNPIIYKFFYNTNNFNFYYCKSLFNINKSFYGIKIRNLNDFFRIFNYLQTNNKVDIYGAIIKSIFWNFTDLCVISNNFSKDLSLEKLKVLLLFKKYYNPLLILPLLFNKISKKLL